MQIILSEQGKAVLQKVLLQWKEDQELGSKVRPDGEASLANTRAVTLARKIILQDRSMQKAIQNRDLLYASVRYIIELGMGMTPEEYDATYSTKLNRQFSLEYAIREIVKSSNPIVRQECLFSNKLMVLRACFPEYYHQHYTKPSAFDIVLMKQDGMRADFIHASKLRPEQTEEGLKFRDQLHYGSEVDQIIYHAFQEIWPTFFKNDTYEMFTAFANAKKLKLSSLFGSIKVIEARGCYPSLLDFWMWNSPIEYQREHLQEYIRARKAAKLEPLPEIDLVVQALQYLQEQDIDLEKD